VETSESSNLILSF